MTYQELINNGKETLNKANIYDGFAFNLMLELCEIEGINLYLEKDSECPTELATDYENKIIRLANDEPLAYVLGFEWFYGRRFKVNGDVLIPRQETEELIANVIIDIDDLFQDQPIVVADVATGSGNCAITLKLECPQATVIATDISEGAIAVAKENAESLEADVAFSVGDMGQPLIAQHAMVDVLVCNPPYILDSEEVQSSVLTYEPHTALFGGDDGLKFYRQILDEAKTFLKPKSMMAFEMGWQQRNNLNAEILARFPDARVEFKKDINHKDRMCFVYLNN